MTTQEFSPSTSLGPTDLQSEFERLFGEVERLLNYPATTQQQLQSTTNRWAYMPDEADSEQQQNTC